MSSYVSEGWPKKKVEQLRRRTEERREGLLAKRDDLTSRMGPIADPAETRRRWEQTLKRLGEVVSTEGWRLFTDEPIPDEGDLAAWAEERGPIWSETMPGIFDDLGLRVVVDKSPDRVVSAEVSCSIGKTFGVLTRGRSPTIAPSSPTMAQEWTLASTAWSLGENGQGVNGE